MALTTAEFAQLIDEHADTLYRIAYRMVGKPHEAEDLVQETFRSAWSSREHYQTLPVEDAEAPPPTGRAWLVSILRRRATDVWRRHRLPLVSVELPDVGVDPHDPFEQQYSDEMQMALNQLSADLREALLLVVVGELTHQETADVLGVPLGTVLSRVSRARARLRESLLTLRKS